MEQRKKISIIIPCYNEEEGIPYLKSQLIPTIEELEKNYDTELIFIDDGSTDKTNELLHQNFTSNNVKIIKHEVNKNLGQALKTGFSNVTGNLIATIDSDCTYNPKLLIEMVKMIDQNTDMVTASPYHPKGSVENVPQYRLFLSKSISLIYRLITKEKLHTFTALFRISKKDLIDNIEFHSKDFLSTAEILIDALSKGYKIKEFPTTLHVRKYGVSKIRLFLVMKSHTKYILKLLKQKLQ